MKSFRYIALGILLTFGALSAILYSSCSKNTCGAVTCLNKSSCSGGICNCSNMPGIGGANCEIEYRKLFAHNYIGYASGTVGHADTISLLTFRADADSTDFTTMHVDWIDTNTQMLSLPIAISNYTTAGATFSVVPTNIGYGTITGNGNLSTTSASMDLTYTFNAGGSQSLHFHDFSRQ